MTLFTVLGLAIACTEAVPTVLQVRHSRAHGVAGVNSATNTAWLFSWLLWCMFGVAIGEVPVIIQNAAGFVACAVMVRLLWAHHQVSVRTTLLLLALHVAIGAVMVQHLAAGVAILAACDVLFVVPQIRTAWQQRDIGGLSHSAYRFSVIMDLAWIAYAIGIGHPFAAAWSFIALMFGAAILLRMQYGSRRSTQHAS